MQQPPAPYRPQPPMPYASTSTNTLAVVSLIAGISAFFITHFIGAAVALITGYMARREIRQTGEGGATMARAGIILGYVYFALLALVLIAIALLLLGIGAVIVGGSHTS